MEKEFNERRDKLIEIYTNQALPAYQEYLSICRSKRGQVDYDAYKALQRKLNQS